MEINQLFVSLIILLVPGIVATLTLSATVQHKKWDNFTFSVYVILFGCSCYFSMFVIQQIIANLPSCKERELQFAVFKFLANLKCAKLENGIYWNVFFACFIGFALSLFAARGVNHKWLNRLLQKWNISDKYGDESLFYYYLNSGNRTEFKWLLIRDYESNIDYTGALGSFSEQDSIQEIVLLNVDVYRQDGSNYHLDDIYLCGRIGQFSIEPLTISP